MDFFNTRFLNPAIDSLTAAIPTSFCELGTVFQDHVMHISTLTGEELENKLRPVTYDKNGVKFGAKIVSLFGKDYLYVTFNSKLLFSDYFHGLHSGNFRRVFDFACNVLEFQVDYFVFLENALVFDVDFKIDFQLNDESFSNFLVMHKNIVNTKLFRSNYGSYLDLSYYSGLQFVNRADASIAKPFVKFYSKYLELHQRSSEFLFYAGISCNPYLRRLEFTVKNSRHFDALGVSNKLLSVLSLDAGQITSFVLDAYKKHVGMSAAVVSQADAVLSTDFTLAKWVTYQSLLATMELSNVGLATLLEEYFESYPELTVSSKSRKIRQMKAEFKVFMNLQRKFDLTRFRLSGSDVFLSKGKV